MKNLSTKIGVNRQLIRSCAFVAASMVLANGSAAIDSNQPESIQSPDELYQELIATPTPLPVQHLDLKQLPIVEDVDLLVIDDNIKKLLDQKIAPISSQRMRAFELHRLLFKPIFIGISYDYAVTHTAQETFDKRIGNCLSHAALYVAAARYVGLNANFQIVEVPRDWLAHEDFYVVPSHMNVAVRIPGNKITVEFTEVYSANQTKNLKSHKVSDREALAEYYNNIGMEYMEKKDRLTAIAYMRKATDTYKKVGFVWSNLGVVYKMTGHLELAEAAYEKAIKYDKKNLSIMKNLYLLYQQTNRHEEAAKFARKVERYSKQNPYYLERLAAADISMGNYRDAVGLLRKAIDIKPEESKFHVSLSYAYHQLGHYKKSIEAMTRAKENAENEEEFEGYAEKLRMLREYRAGL